MFCFWPECLGFLLPHGKGPGENLEAWGSLVKQGTLTRCPAFLPSQYPRGCRARRLLGAKDLSSEAPLPRLRPAPVGSLWAGWAAGPARASRSCLESGQLKPDTWLPVPRGSCPRGWDGGVGPLWGPAWGRLRALFVLAAASKSEELLIASRGPPSAVVLNLLDP